MTDSDSGEAATKRDGLLSYPVEKHAAVFGSAMGAWVAYSPGQALPVLGMLLAVVFGGEAVGQVRKQVPGKVRRQIRKEAPYFLGAIPVGYLGFRGAVWIVAVLG